MKSCDCSTAPSPRRVRIFAAEKRLEIERAPVDPGIDAEASNLRRWYKDVAARPSASA